MQYDKKCVYCGERYTAARSDSKTCSSSCRVKYNALKGGMQLIGTVPATSNGKGGCLYFQKDVDDLCGKDKHCKLYLRYDAVNNVMNVYSVGCDPHKRYCEKKGSNSTKKGAITNSNIGGE